MSAALTLLAATAGLAGYADRRPGFRDPAFDAKVRDLADRFATGGEPIRVVALGSSRTAAAVEPAGLEAALGPAVGRPVVAYNLSVPGNGPVSQLVHYSRLRKVRPRPDLVLAELLPAAFGWREGGPYDARVLRPDRLTRGELEAVCQCGFPEADTRDGWHEATLNPWFGFRFQLLGRVIPKWVPPGARAGAPTIARDAGGWHPWGPLPAGTARRRIAEVKAVYEPQLRAARFEGPHALAFEHLLRECRADGVRVAVVVPPEGSEFRRWYPAEVEAGLAAYLARLRSEFGVPVLDARAWLPDEAFADTHHVLGPWSRPYTERLAREAAMPALAAAGRGDR